MKRFSAIFFFIIILACFFLNGCNVNSRYDSEFFAMDTVMTVTAFGSNSEKAVKAAESKINKLDALLSVQNTKSEINRLNSEKSIIASDDTLKLISRAKEISKMTDGAFDITTEPLTRAWGFYSGLENRVPSKSELEKLLKSVGAEHINIDGSTVTLDKNTSIDLGGIAKGYAAHIAAELFNENKVSSALISLGGNVRAVGTKPDGSRWLIAITDPDNNEKSIGTVAVEDCSVVTSGGYRRFFEQDGQLYHHIIDTKTGAPAKSGVKSVTVVSSDDTLADALSTALFVMGVEKSALFYKENSSLFDAVIITDSNRLYVTENLCDSFSSQRKYEVITR